MRHLAACLPVLCALSFVPAQPPASDVTVEGLRGKAKAVLAQVSGKITVPGLRQPVEVLRDNWGVPHIYASDPADLFFAQGFVAAQDRLFQIDLWRRIGTGETAAVLGEQALEGDRFARLVKYRGDMDAEWQSYAPDAKKIAAAFTAGINVYIDQIGDRLPIEFQILGYRPEKWAPEDILGRMSGIIMTDNWEMELYRAVLIQAKGLEQARLLAPTDPRLAFAPPKGLDLQGIDLGIASGYEAATKPLQFRPSKRQSNNWVVSGRLSASGKPLLASDPHRAVALPSLRYLVHLNAPGWNVIGSGEPALPGVAIGHNERIAWGFTIVSTDQSDIYVEQLNPQNHAEYKVGDRWEKLTVICERVAVKGRREPVEMELKFTRHGPVIHEDAKGHRAFALKWGGSEPGTAGYLGSLAVDRARDWKQFLKALEAWKVPNENIVYADVDGNIGWVAAALTPEREGYTGLLPVPGNSGAKWERFLRVSELPQEFNPERGWIATANHNILPPGYGHAISYDWAPGYRYRRIQSLLEGKEGLTLEDMRDIQQDVVSLPGRTLVRLAKQVNMQDPGLEKYADVLRAWDGDLSLQSRAGPLYAAWKDELEKEFYGPRYPKELLPQVRYLGGTKLLLTALEHPEGFFGADPTEARDTLLRETFAKAVGVVCDKLGEEPSKWSWGKMHTVTFRHPLSGLGPAYAEAFNLGPVGRPGDSLTVNNTRSNDAYEQVHGATYRELFDLSDWDKGLATSAPGQSGQPGSRHYGDLLPLWARGEYFPLAYSRRKVEEVTEHRMELVPE